ncbi:MAG: hypothetical protein HY913_04360 [Desulfomonile tiedjei]|nr:hypothetical protein [Desulfomonile tiedjei]
METRDRHSGMSLLRDMAEIGIVVLLSCFLISCGQEPPKIGPDRPPTVPTLPTTVPTISATVPTVPTFPTFPMFHSALPTRPHVRPESIESLDEMVKGLDWGQIAFNTPKQMELDETTQIELLLSLTKPIEDLKRDVKAAGEKEGYPVRVSDYMEARLTGPGFQITATTPEQQVISSLETPVWKWDVKAIRPGMQALHLTLSAILAVGGQNRLLVVRTFDRQLEIRVSVADRVTSFVGENWQWLWAAVLVPVATAVWAWWKRRKKSKKKKHN